VIMFNSSSIFDFFGLFFEYSYMNVPFKYESSILGVLRVGSGPWYDVPTYHVSSLVGYLRTGYWIPSTY
jgi:hypothetical protein